MAGNVPALETPAHCTADFSLIPIGGSSASFSRLIADIEKMVKNTGLTFKMNPTGTTIDGSWDQVILTIGYAHTLVHQSGIPRVQSDIRVMTRTDKVQPMEANITSVEKLMTTQQISV